MTCYAIVAHMRCLAAACVSLSLQPLLNHGPVAIIAACSAMFVQIFAACGLGATNERYHTNDHARTQYTHCCSLLTNECRVPPWMILCSYAT